MPKRSAVTQLPPVVKAWLDQSLVEGNFSGYQALADELKGRGYEVSKSSLHRYGSSFEERIEKLKIATEQAKAVVQSAPDDEGAMGDALTRLVQQKTFDILLDLEVDPESVKLADIGTMVAKLNATSVQQKKWQAEVKRKAQVAAAEVETVAKAGGLSEETVEAIKKRILGIGS